MFHSKMKPLGLACSYLFLLFTHSFSHAASSIESLEERLDEMELYIAELESRVGGRTVASSFDSIQFDIGGFLHSAYTHVNTNAGSQGSFNRNNFELLISTKLNESWSAFIASGFLRESDDPLITNGALRTQVRPSFNSRNKTPSIIANVNFHHSDIFNIRLGRQITPQGIINIEHFPASLLDTEQPQFLRPFSGNTIFPNFFTGIQLHGTSYNNSTSTFYNAYLGNHSSLANSTIGGLRLGVGLLHQAIEIGLNAHRGDRLDLQQDYAVYGIDLKLDYKSWLIKTEYYDTREETSFNDREAFYLQPAFRLNNQWVVFARHDILDNPSDQGKQVEQSIGVNYLPSSNIQLRAIVRNTRYKDQNNFDADTLQLSGTFSF